MTVQAVPSSGLAADAEPAEVVVLLLEALPTVSTLTLVEGTGHVFADNTCPLLSGSDLPLKSISDVRTLRVPSDNTSQVKGSMPADNLAMRCLAKPQ